MIRKIREKRTKDKTVAREVDAREGIPTVAGDALMTRVN